MILRAFFFALLAAGLAVPADEAEPTGLGCIENLEIPKYPRLARQSSLDGLVRLQLSWRDKWQNLDVKPSIFEGFAWQVGATAFLRKACQSRPVELVFEFRMRPDSPAGKQDDRITLVAPNRFIITTNRAEVNY